MMKIPKDMRSSAASEKNTAFFQRQHGHGFISKKQVHSDFFPPVVQPQWVSDQFTRAKAGGGLSHGVQQKNTKDIIRRSPQDENLFSTESMHEELLEEYIKDTGTSPESASRFSIDYEIWLAVKSGTNIQFEKPTLKRVNPLDRLEQGLPTGKTELLINGNLTEGADLSTQIAKVKSALKPHDFVFEQRPDGSWKCRVSPAFKVKASPEITITTMPGNNGWNGNVSAAKLGVSHACAGKVPVNLRGKPTHNQFADVVKDSEMEHVNEVEKLHNRHFVPYYHKVMPLQGFGKSEADAKTDLLNKLKPMLDEATLGFSVADIAEARKFDAPGSTHQGKFTVTSINKCNPVLVESAQDHPQQIGLQPGNVRIIQPQRVNFTTANLRVAGNNVTEGGRIIKSLSNQANANTALGIFQHFGATSLNSIGPFEFLLVNGKSPSGVFNGIGHLAIDPEKYQVTIGFPKVSDWVISEVKGDQYFPILNFGNNRDRAYSAVDIMRGFQFTHQHWIGASGNPEFMFFTVD